MSAFSVKISVVLDFRVYRNAQADIGWAPTTPTTSLRISRGSNAGLDTGEFTTYDGAHNVVNHGVRLAAGTFTLIETISLLRLAEVN